MKLRKILQISAGIVFFLAIAGYSFYQAADYRQGASISIDSPQDGFVTDRQMIEITGSAERVAYLSLNGRQIYTDRSGNFSEQLLLADGYNIITIAAEDDFNRHSEKQITVILEDAPEYYTF